MESGNITAVFRNLNALCALFAVIFTASIKCGNIVNNFRDFCHRFQNLNKSLRLFAPTSLRISTHYFFNYWNKKIWLKPADIYSHKNLSLVLILKVTVLVKKMLQAEFVELNFYLGETICSRSTAFHFLTHFYN